MDWDAENAVLGGALQTEDGLTVLRQLATMLQVSDFYQEGHRTIYARMLAVHAAGVPVDQITIVSALREHGELDAIGGPAKIQQLCTDGLFTIPARTPVYVALIVEAAKKRALDVLGQRMTLGARNGSRASDVMRDAIDTLEEIRRRPAARRPDETPSELTALLAHPFERKPEIIGRGVLPRAGLMISGGDPKLGKSLMVGNALLCRALGREWLGFPTDAGVSLVVQSELHAEAIAERYRTMRRHQPDPFPEGRLHIKACRGVMLDEVAGLAQIRDWIEETGADLLVIDPLARHMAGDENSNRDMGVVVRAVDSLVERYGVAVWIVHHPSKPRDGQQRSGGMRLRGASALFGAADTVMMLDPDGDKFRLTFELRHGAAPEPIRLSRDENLWLVPTGPEPEAQLLAFAGLTTSRPLAYNALVTAGVENLKLSKGTAKRRVGEAIGAKLLEKDADGLYRPTPVYRHAVLQSHEGSANA
jgi:hypothetical protein